MDSATGVEVMTYGTKQRSNANEVIKSKVANKADGARKIPEEDIQNVL